MHIKVRELIAKAAYHGITRNEIATRAKIGSATFTSWKKRSPRLDTFDKASKALDELIVLRGMTSEKVEG